MVLLDELEERSTGVYVLRSPVLDELERSDGWEVVPRSTSDVAERLGCVVVPRSPEPSLLLVSAADRLARSPTLLELPELPLIPRAVPLPSLADSPREVAVAEPPSGVPRLVRLPAAPPRSAGKRWAINESRLSPPRSYD